MLLDNHMQKIITCDQKMYCLVSLDCSIIFKRQFLMKGFTKQTSHDNMLGKYFIRSTHLLGSTPRVLENVCTTSKLVQRFHQNFARIRASSISGGEDSNNPYSLLLAPAPPPSSPPVQSFKCFNYLPSHCAWWGRKKPCILSRLPPTNQLRVC